MPGFFFCPGEPPEAEARTAAGKLHARGCRWICGGPPVGGQIVSCTAWPLCDILTETVSDADVMPFVWTGTQAVGLCSPGGEEKANRPRYFLCPDAPDRLRHQARGRALCSLAAAGRLPGDISPDGSR